MTFWKLELGQYNWDSEEDVWRLTLRTPYGQVSAIFPKDAQPDVDPEWTTPSEVLDLIEARFDSWIQTKMVETKAAIAEIRRHSNEINAAWLDQHIKHSKGKSCILHKIHAELDQESKDG